MMKLAQTRGETKSYPRNLLRTVLYVAARGSVGRRDVEKFQKGLPEDDWGEVVFDGFERFKDVLAWAIVPTGEHQTLTIREVLQGLANAVDLKGRRHPQRGVLRDVEYLLTCKKDVPELQACMILETTEIGLRLGKRRTRMTRTAYEEAILLASSETEDARTRFWLDDPSLNVAVDELQRLLDEMSPPALYEAANLFEVARAMLALPLDERTKDYRCAVVLDARQKLHRLFLTSRLELDALAIAIGVPRLSLRKSSLAVRNFEPAEDSFGYAGVPLRSLLECNPLLQSALQHERET